MAWSKAGSAERLHIPSYRRRRDAASSGSCDSNIPCPLVSKLRVAWGVVHLVGKLWHNQGRHPCPDVDLESPTDETLPCSAQVRIDGPHGG